MSAATAPFLPAEVERPDYVPEHHGIGIVHLGVGAFHRAHQAAYVDDVLSTEGGDWRIRGVSLRSSDVRNRLSPQDCLFTRVERDACGERLRLTASIAEVLAARENPQAVIRAIADPAIHIVSLTITEKGYCHNPATGELDERHPDVVHDLANPERPRGALGILVEALTRRHQAGSPAPTLLCCDNLPDNGRVLARVLGEFAKLRNPAVAGWIEANVACPATMVDRIVPATTEDDIRCLSERLGFEDCAMVKTEPFTQWVIEDSFGGPRPAFERVGAQIVPDVRPFELAKLRMLNGAHSTLAYAGLRLGLVYAHEAVADPDLRSVVEHLMRFEAAPTLPPAKGLEPESYAAALLDRFANPALEHRLFQIAMDGSQKLPQRLLGTIRERISRGFAADAALLGVAAWMLHATGRGPGNSRHEVDDPLASTLAAVAERCGSNARTLADGMLSINGIFGNLAELPSVAEIIAQHIEGLQRSPRDWLHRVAARLPGRAAA
ncbi:MAG TPA: mannitol dehydrogenase family protein [Sphingomicrobium sp.]|nr:mannitol dehydrogenase family protein [Sphingomicrobium sp.]